MFYAIFFAYSDILVLQEQLIQSEKWREYFPPEKLSTPIEEVDLSILNKSNSPIKPPKPSKPSMPSSSSSSESKSKEEAVVDTLKVFQDSAIQERSTSPFTLHKKPEPKELETYWQALAVKGKWDQEKVKVDYHEYWYVYEHADRMLKANSALCHYVAFLPKELHESYLKEYCEFIDCEYLRPQQSYPEVRMHCDYLKITAEK